MLISRGGRPSRLPSAVAATASVGLMTAPIRDRGGKHSCGNSRKRIARRRRTRSQRPVPTLSAEMLRKLRRKSTIGTLSAAE